jgi:thioredoxin 1
MAEVKAVTDETFEEVVLNAERPIIVDFWAAWCGPCRMVSPELEKIAQKYAGAIDVVKMDVDANPAVSQALQITTLPTIAFFRPGQQPMAVIGAMPAEQVEARFGLSQYATAQAN